MFLQQKAQVGGTLRAECIFILRKRYLNIFQLITEAAAARCSQRLRAIHNWPLWKARSWDINALQGAAGCLGQHPQEGGSTGQAAQPTAKILAKGRSASEVSPPGLTPRWCLERGCTFLWKAPFPGRQDLRGCQKKALLVPTA